MFAVFYVLYYIEVGASKEHIVAFDMARFRYDATLFGKEGLGLLSLQILYKTLCSVLRSHLKANAHYDRSKLSATYGVYLYMICWHYSYCSLC